MEKVVSEAIKIDLHIHSCHSSHKDGDKVANNTKENLPILISKLINNSVNMVSITDHDMFSYDMYKTLKEQEEKDNCILKVLPGIEFSVEFIPGKQIHIVTIFDDSDEEKVKKIETVMTSGLGKEKYSKSKQQYTQKDYIDVLDEIGIDFVMIAHQKKSLLSTDAKPKANDVNSLGDDVLNELIFMDYFDAFEFRNKKNELYNKSFQIDSGLAENVRFITGSDCHRWEYYPYTEKGEVENFTYTYLKSLPCFKGLALAITDNHRIAYENKFFNPLEEYVNEIRLKVKGEIVSIPLSRGINVVIGDNSVGKSLFLHELTSNMKLSDRGILQGYKKYLEKKDIRFETHISDDQIFMFNTQGEIRGIFDKDGLKPDLYLKQFYPNEINYSKYRKMVELELEKLYQTLKNKFIYDDHKSKLPNFKIYTGDFKPMGVTFTNNKKKKNEKDLKQLIDGLENIYNDIAELKKNNILEERDKEQLERMRENLSLMRTKYSERHDETKKENARINKYNTFLNSYKQNYSKRITDEQAVYSAFVSGKEKAIEALAGVFNERRALNKYEPSAICETVIPETNPVDRFEFVSKVSVEKIDSDYISKLIKSVLKQRKTIDTQKITEKQLGEYIKNNNDENADQVEQLKAKISARLDKDFAPKNAIVESGMDVYQEVSSGFDAQMYFTLISGEVNNKGVYIIDQPEDHISQKAIKERVNWYLLKVEKWLRILFLSLICYGIQSIHWHMRNLLMNTEKNTGSLNNRKKQPSRMRSLLAKSIHFNQTPCRQVLFAI